MYVYLFDSQTLTLRVFRVYLLLNDVFRISLFSSYHPKYVIIVSRMFGSPVIGLRNRLNLR